MTQEVPELVPTEVPELAPPEIPEPVQKCANCGADLRPTDRYCGGCGLPAFVPAKAEVTAPAPAPEPVPAAAPKPPATTVASPAQKADNRVWAIVAGVILLLVGVASCGIGVIAMATASWFATDTGIDPSMWTAGSGLCCVLPSVLLMIAGAVVWYAWGRKKA
jgi:hypothetical protein